MPTLNWIGKEAVIHHHRDVPFRLLEPVSEYSTGDSCGNLLVQGDNLDALKALLPKYAGKVKLIYIDPPYNTGNEGWIYNDNVNSPQIRKWLGQVVGKEDLDRHDRWLCMMYPRLMLLKQFLRDDGAIFISIDDNEQANLKILCDEIFGINNFVASISIVNNLKGRSDSKFIATAHESLLFYKMPNFISNGVSLPSSYINEYKLSDEKGSYRLLGLRKRGAGSKREDRPNMFYPIYYNINNNKLSLERCYPEDIEIIPRLSDGSYGRWRWGKDTTLKRINELVAQKIKKRNEYDIFQKDYNTEEKTIKPKSVWQGAEFSAEAGTLELKNIFGERTFDNCKSTNLIQYCIQQATDNDSLILDSFAGSGTTGHAVLKQNSEDGGTRRFILVEMDKDIAEKVASERIKRISKGYLNAKGQQIDGLGGNFQYCRLSDEPLFTPSGQIREDVSFSQLASFVWFLETKTAFSGKTDSPLLGVHEGRAIYLLYNGILDDIAKDGGNVLTPELLGRLPKHDGPKTIYASSVWGDNWLEQEDITFKQTPYKLKTS